MLKKIWKPLQIRKLTLPNRIIMGSMHLGVEGNENGIERLIAFYQERAKGGVGLIVTGGIAVNLEGAGGAHFLTLHNDESIEKFLPLTKAIRQAGGRIAAQLFHAGRYADKGGTGLTPVAPSPLKATINEITPRELSNEEIIQTITDFANAAKRAQNAGFDAVEIMGSEGYLINQFLSPVTNHRTDEWGGNYKNRVKFAISIVQKIRDAVGEDYPVFFRISGLDLMPNSTSLEETIQLAKDLEAAGVDVLNVGIGWHESIVPTIAMFVPRASYAWVAEAIRQHVSVPVVASNRINQLELAEHILQTEQADLISMARPFLADPMMLVKAKSGHVEEIQTCVACNQACLDHVFTGQPVSCVVNPRAGHELEQEWDLISVKEENRKRVAVIGAGPAGLEAARVLGERGHYVILYEQKSNIGGQLHIAAMVPGKEEWKEALRYYQVQIDKLPINLQLNKHATIDDILKENVDHVVVATGSVMNKPEIKGIELPHVISYLDVLEGKVSVGKNIAIIGAGGIAVDLSHYLSEKILTPDTIPYLLEYQISNLNEVKQFFQSGRNITMMRRKGKIGASLGRTTRWAVLQRLQQKGINMLVGIEYKEITEEGVIIQYKDRERLILADTVILATGQEENDHLYKEMKNNGISVSVIGGANRAGELDAKKAIAEGAKTGRLI